LKKNNATFENIQAICKKAMREGQIIDLKDCHYGTSFLDGSYIDHPVDYYFFLAGLVKVQKLTHILEIGTHMGGAIISMSKGLNYSDIKTCKLATIDEIRKNENKFKKYPHIKRIQGDPLDKKVVKNVVEYFGRDIDLLFIDSTHTYGHVKRCIAVYANKLKPKYIILDDIHFNKSMQKLWWELIAEFKNKTFDLTRITNRGKDGFGLIYEWNDFKWNWEYAGFMLKVLEVPRIVVSRMLPPRLKNTIEKILKRKLLCNLWTMKR